MSNQTDITAHILLSMRENGIPLNKVVIQKASYFLKAYGAPVGFRFRPYTYGPFSFDLQNELSDMVFWGTISLEGHTYHIENLDTAEVSDDTAQRIADGLSKFAETVAGNFDFNTMELFGTTLYCCRALKLSGETVSLKTVQKEFKEWKDAAYSDEQIRRSYNTLKENGFTQ